MSDLRLYDFQEGAVQALLRGKHFCISQTGTGKTPISIIFASRLPQAKVLVVTTASVRDSHQFEQEAERWCPVWYKSLSSFSVVSWAGLAKWTVANWNSLPEYTVIFDEVACAKAGVGSERGRAFLQVAKYAPNWAGFTATPGDKWIDFYAYFTACKKVKNKSEFLRNFCTMQNYKGYPEIVEYRHTDQLKEWWKEISFAPDASKVFAELPPETHKRIFFSAPAYYKKAIATHVREDGTVIDNPPALAHYLRQLCLTKKKLEWVKEFVDSLGCPAVLFYNYIEEGERLEKEIKKLKARRKVWRIDGKTHDIPTQETIGKRDVVLCQWQSGSMGLNLQFINYWVSISPCYSYSIYLQGQGRIKRIGQTKPMFFYELCCQKSVEQQIYECLSDKKDFADDVWMQELEADFM